MVFAESTPSTPLIFILSPGTDPAADLYKFADVMEFSKKMRAISLGQGQVRIIFSHSLFHTLSLTLGKATFSFVHLFRRLFRLSCLFVAKGQDKIQYHFDG